MHDLANLGLKELKQLAVKVEKEISARTSRSALRKRFEAMAEAEGVSLETLVGKGDTSAPQASAPATRKAPMKFVHPSNRKLAWSGRGSRPAWVRVWLEHGGSMDALATAAMKLAARTA